ncbi:MAG: hypothetical protein ABIH00_08880, partial [Armatimonadota bacterium]
MGNNNTDMSGAVNLAKIPQGIKEALKETNIDAKSDGQKGLSSLDLLNAHYKHYEKGIFGLSKIKDEKQFKEFKYKLSSFFSYLYNTDKKTALAMQAEIARTSPWLGGDIDNLFGQLNAIHGEQILHKKGIVFSINPKLHYGGLIGANIGFEEYGNDIKVSCTKQKFGVFGSL